MTRKFLLIILLASSFLLNGCWDRRELESLGLVQALGLDLGPGGNGITVTTMIAIPPKITGGGSQSGGGGGGTGSGVFTISMNAPTVYEGFNLINTTINREVTLLQTSVILIGENLAKQGIQKIVDNLVRFREMRRTILIFVCRGTAAEIMKVQPLLEKNPAEYFTGLVNLSYRTGMFPVVTLNNFMNGYEEFAQEDFAPLLVKFKPLEPETSSNAAASQDQKNSKDQKSESTKGMENIRISGTAIFKKDKMVGTLDVYESIALQLLTGQFREALLSISDPLNKNYQIAYRLLATTTPHLKYTRHPTDQFKINFKLEADLLSIESGINYTTPRKEVLLGSYIAGELKRRIVSVIVKAQKEYGSDIFGFGKTVRATFLTSPAWERYHWPDRFATAKIAVNVKVALRRVGVQFSPPELR